MTQLVEDRLEAGREAARRHAWQEAFELLSAIEDDPALTGSDLESLAEAAWWTGRFDRCVDYRERAFRRHTADGDTAQAAVVALALARDYHSRGNNSMGTGWYARAERLLSGLPESEAHGYLRLAQTDAAVEEGRLDEAIDLAGQTLDIGTRFGNRDLQAFAIMMEGRALIGKGQVPEGLALMDEATVAAVSGDLTPFASGVIYCLAIGATQAMADYRRAGEWTEAARKWCERLSIAGGFPGVCRVHRAEIVRLRGSWEEAEQEALLAAKELKDVSVPIASEALYEIGEIRLRMGDLDAAEQAFREAHQMGRDPQPGMAVLQAARGDLESAAASIHRALGFQSWDRLARAKLLPYQVQIDLARGDLPAARAGAEELDEVAEAYGSTALQAAAACALGGVALAEGDVEAASTATRKGWQLWRQVEAPYEAARAQVLLGEVFLRQGDQGGAKLELTAARQVFDRLGASLDAMRVDRLLEAMVQAAEGAARSAQPERAVRTFMFTDIVRSTALIEAIGDDAWRDLLAWHDQKLRGLFAEHKGEEIVHTGDGFFTAFPGTMNALECAVAIQRELAEHRRAHGFSPQVRIGLHAGEALKVGSNYTGKGVNQAARIGALAEGNEILATRATAALCEAEFTVSEPRSVTLKGIAEPVEVVSVDWR